MAGHRRGRGVFAGALFGALAVVLLAGSASEAAYPGKPGRIVFKRTGISCCEIWTVDLKGNDLQLTENGYSQGDPSYSADGRLITFRGRPPGGIADADIFVMNADGSNERQLTLDNAFEDNEPNFHPDGETIFFQSARDGDEDIFRMNASDGSGIVPVGDTDDGIGEVSPAISPNGKLIAYTRLDGTDENVWVMRSDGLNQRPLTELNGASGDSAFEPNFSPDGRMITYVVYDGTDSEIWVMKANGEGERQLTNNDEEDDTPSFSPDGSRVTFDSTIFEPLADEIVSMSLKTGKIKRHTDQTTESDTTPDWGPIPVKCGGRRATLVGTGGRDKLFGTPEADVIAGLGGGDLIKGKGGKDRLCGGKGKDRLNGGGRRDRCVGGPGRDVARGCERSRSI